MHLAGVQKTLKLLDSGHKPAGMTLKGFRKSLPGRLTSDGIDGGRHLNEESADAGNEQRVEAGVKTTPVKEIL
jgi:hypothetical protein